eukprot:scaffold3570_cov69-Phaeocystis_antarctica.AAC.4
MRGLLAPAAAAAAEYRPRLRPPPPSPRPTPPPPPPRRPSAAACAPPRRSGQASRLAGGDGPWPRSPWEGRSPRPPAARRGGCA